MHGILEDFLGGDNMNNYDYLTETEKFLFGYTENIPTEYEHIEEAWDEEYIEENEAINDILNIK